MRMIKTIGALLVVSTMAVAGLAIAASNAPEGNPAVGAELFNSCVPCHTLNGNGVAGKPVQELLTKMRQYQTGTFDNPKVQGMQKALQSMNEQNLLDLAAYMTKM